MPRSIARWSCGIALLFRCAERWFTSRSENALCVLGCLKDGGADREMKDAITKQPDQQHSTAGSFVVRDVRKTDTSVQECCGSTGTSLSLSAIRLSSGSERAFILCIRRLRCTFTVASAMPISPALFAKAAVRDLNHDLALPGAQRLEAFPEGGQSFFILPPSAIASEAELNGVEEFLITERLRKELNGTALHRLNRHRDVAVPRDEDDWDFPVRRGELAP